jgi:hypothetical protein
MNPADRDWYTRLGIDLDKPAGGYVLPDPKPLDQDDDVPATIIDSEDAA